MIVADSSTLRKLVALVAVVVFVAGIARKLGTSAPLMLTVVGIGLGYLPGVPIIEVEQEVVLLGLLPPLLYAAAIRTSANSLGHSGSSAS